MDFFDLRDRFAVAAGIAGIMDTTKRNAEKATPDVKAAYQVIYDDHLARLKVEVEKAKSDLDKTIAVRSAVLLR
jgi:hypothetical protein